MKFKDKRFAIWGVSGFFAWAIFIVEGIHRHYGLLASLGIAVLWGLGSVFTIATLIHLKYKR